MPKRKINILFVEYCKDLKGGGAQRVFLDILKSADLNVFNAYAAFPDVEKSELKREIPKHIKTFNYDSKSPSDSGNGIKAYVIFSLFIPLVVLKWFFIIKRNNIDVVYVHSIISGFHFSLIKKLSNIKLIYHEHNLASQRPDTFLWRHLFKFVINNADSVISISHSVADSLLIAGVAESKIQVIHNGINNVDVDFNALNEKGIKRLNLSDSDFIVGMVGHFRSWKGQMHFVEMANQTHELYPEIKFVLIGGVHDSEYYNQVVNYITENGLLDSIFIMGHQDYVDELIAAMDIVLVPSVPEPFGLVVIEAMRLKKPVVAFNIGGPSEIIENEKTGVLVDDITPEGLVKAVVGLRKDNEKLLAMGENARVSFLSGYTLEVQSDKIAKLVLNMKFEN